MNVLLRFNHGLGDAVQFTVVLKHLRHFHPDWQIDVRSLRGKHSAFHELCRRSYHDQEAAPLGPHRVFDIQWCENYNRYSDRPNSKITNCLEEVFHVPYRAELGRYQVNVGDGAKERAAQYLESIGCRAAGGSRADASGLCDTGGALAGASGCCGGRYNAVVFHYQGNTSQHKKNLAHDTVAGWVELCLAAGYVPVILDWDRRSPLADQRRVFNPGVHAGDIWGRFGSGDAETITALIGAASAFVGIDSGPGKCASATETPALIAWTGHHPIQFHDPADNTVHLVPDNHCQIPPAQNPGVADYFLKHYRHRTYAPGREANLAAAGAEWLAGIMGTERRPAAEGLVFQWGFWVPGEQPMQAWTIIDDIFVKDAYKTYLRPRRDGEEYVVDVGANIGAFAALWHKRNPGARIACLEVNPKLMPALEANVGEFATVIPCACHYDLELYLLDAVCRRGCRSAAAGSWTGTPLCWRGTRSI